MNSDYSTAVKGEIKYRNVCDMRGTILGMTPNQWYEFDYDSYHGWFQFARLKSSNRDFTVSVKTQDRRTFVMRVPKEAES